MTRHGTVQLTSELLLLRSRWAEAVAEVEVELTCRGATSLRDGSLFHFRAQWAWREGRPRSRYRSEESRCDAHSGIADVEVERKTPRAGRMPHDDAPCDHNVRMQEVETEVEVCSCSSHTPPHPRIGASQRHSTLPSSSISSSSRSNLTRHSTVQMTPESYPSGACGPRRRRWSWKWK